MRRDRQANAAHQPRLSHADYIQCLMPPRKPGCLQCRKRHVRCDSNKPACGTCRKARDGRKCSYVSLDIRPARYVSRLGRQTLDTSQTFTIVPQVPANGTSSEVVSQAGDPGNVSKQDTTSKSAISPSLSEGDRRRQESRVLSGPAQKFGAVSDPLEARLFEYYIKDAGYYLDIVSPDYHLSKAASTLALTDPLLYSACLAYSSHVLWLLGRVDKATEQRFNDSAIQLLIQKLSEDPFTWSEGSVLTTTVLMRVREQFSEIGDDGEYHLNGAFGITASAGRIWALEPVDLETSAFWVYLRMSVRMCFLCEHPTKCDPVALVRIPRLGTGFATSALAEAALTNRMTYLLAKICNACWPPSRQVDQAHLIDMRAELSSLQASLPPTFEPWSSITTSDNLYPIVKYMSTWHAILWQFSYAAQVLLAANFALLARSPTVASQGQYLEREILGPTRKLLAVAFSNDEIGLRINAAALVGWCGQFLTKTEEQKAVVAWLEKLSTDVAWPSQTVIGRLRRIWAGEQSHWTADPAS